jgi:hypothetical protein
MMFESLRNHFANYTVSGLLGRIPEILAAIKGRLTFAALIVIFIGGFIWLSTGSSNGFAIYAITILALFGGFVIWTDATIQRERMQPVPRKPDPLPDRSIRTADELRREIANLSQTQLLIMKTVARYGADGISIVDLINETRLTRREVFFCAKTLQSANLLKIEHHTEYRYFLSEPVQRLVQRAPTVQALLISN